MIHFKKQPMRSLCWSEMREIIRFQPPKLSYNLNIISDACTEMSWGFGFFKKTRKIISCRFWCGDPYRPDRRCRYRRLRSTQRCQPGLWVKPTKKNIKISQVSFPIIAGIGVSYQVNVVQGRIHGAPSIGHLQRDAVLGWTQGFESRIYSHQGVIHCCK